VNGDFRIGPWLVEPTLNRISHNGASRRLEPKVMQVLVRLSEEQGRVVAKQKLMEKVWPETFVTDDVLTRSISELRDAFGDDARASRIIQTIPKQGYRLLLPVSAAVEPTKVDAKGNSGPRGTPRARRWLIVGGAAVIALAATYVTIHSRTDDAAQYK